MLDFILEPIRETQAFQEADRALTKKEGPVQFVGAVDGLRAFIMAAAGKADTRLLVSASEQNATALYEDLQFTGRGVAYFPAKDFLFYQADAKSNTIAGRRLSVMKGILTGSLKTVVTTAEALMNVLPPLETFEEAVISLKEADETDMKALAKSLVKMGYERTAQVENGGEFSIHGGIVDIFDLTEELPYRIEFFGDEIDTIRTFRPETQLTVANVHEACIFPASEFILDEERFGRGLKAIQADYEANLNAFKENQDYESAASLQALYNEIKDAAERKDFRGVLERFFPYFYEKSSCLLDYLPKDSCIFLEEPNRIEESAKLSSMEFEDSYKNRLLKGLTLPKNAFLIRPVKETLKRLNTEKTLLLTGLDARVNFWKAKSVVRLECSPVVPYAGNYQGMITDLLRYQKQKFRMVLLVPSRTRGSRIAESLREQGVHAYYADDRVPPPEGDTSIRPGSVLVTNGALHRGFTIPLRKFILFTESDIYGGAKRKKTRTRPAMEGERIRSFSELSAGDYVVHESYGIGIYKGIVVKTVDEAERDYMEISYGDSGTLFVPVTSLDMVQKYASKDAKPPKLSRLDSPEWSRTRSRVRAAVQEVAEELVALYAKRATEKGYAFGPDTVWQKEFEEMFPYEETSDQLTAIDEVKRDMESEKIMDRLLCGDVGFGKTEVAIRAAFKAVQEGKQVAYLVPTTILARQHYLTFSERMKDYPVTVEQLSRFTSAENVRRIREGMKSGMTDIVIGTHKILSKDMKFKDLGLLIIDEEQRFGVHQKETIKEIRTNVDVLTLTATPIPRTLHMSMTGIRDMSILAEPPEDRRAVQTYVMEYEEEIAREAILREVQRGGQVYYVYNRTRDIADIAARLSEILPEVRISYVHGKMKEQDVEERMLSFIEGEVDVLCSTTLIETGIDIPNVNTIIIHDAERYGLAQLYQLRGRVGRSGRQAYAFIMYRKDRLPTEEAEKRLEAIHQFTELGSGIHIAMQDLEIRGAGTVLGNAQSGHMALVGYDLYAKMLRAAVQKLKGTIDNTAEEETDTILNIPAEAFIPEDYIPGEQSKLALYKRISCLSSEESIGALKDELIDRYGDIPYMVENLIEVAHCRMQAKKMGITEITGDARRMRFTFRPDAPIEVTKLADLITRMQGHMRYRNGEMPSLQYQLFPEEKTGNATALTRLSELLRTMKDVII